MTDTPDFNDLTPPDELLNELSDAWAHRLAGVGDIGRIAARWGARHGYEQARQLWPEPITDRPPTEADFDEYGWIQVVDDSGFWKGCHWETPVKGRPWQHTPRWQPRQPTLKEQALEAFEHILKHSTTNLGEGTIRRALEQAGEAQS
jgi:hypothetical protein